MATLLRRETLQTHVTQLMEQFPIVSILGPRQSGKSTLARLIAADRDHHFYDLEDPLDEARLANPRTELIDKTGLVIIDEVQRRPELFPLLRVLADRAGPQTRYLILGSASPDIVRGVSESLAGRVGFVHVTGLLLDEVGHAARQPLWSRGGLPRSFLAPDHEVSFTWRQNYITTFLERDLATLGINVAPAAMRRFWNMIAHIHGNIWNAAELARSIGSAESTARRYLDLLTGAFMVRQLPPWFENISKRQVKSPKIYLRDSGILHALLNLRTPEELAVHPKLGASWEGFVIEQIIGLFDHVDPYFWATQSGAELDLFIQHRGRRIGFEVRYADAPRMTPSMRSALEDLRLDQLCVVYPGQHSYTLADRVEVIPLAQVRPLININRP